MNERDDALFEAQLSRLKPSPLPAGLLNDIEAALTDSARAGQPRSGPSPLMGHWRHWLRWLAPAAAAGLVLVIVLTRVHKDPGGKGDRTGSPPPALEATEVVIDRQLVETFDAVATLPGGEPVRLRCREWLEAFTLRNPAQGWEVEQHQPRLEIIPVSLETY